MRSHCAANQQPPSRTSCSRHPSILGSAQLQPMARPTTQRAEQTAEETQIDVACCNVRARWVERCRHEIPAPRQASVENAAAAGIGSFQWHRPNRAPSARVELSISSGKDLA
eukprot:514258-Alexandrium_andersonii.AAC.1